MSKEDKILEELKRIRKRLDALEQETLPTSTAHKQTAAPQPARFPIKIGVTIFGTPSYFDIDAAVSEFKNFVQANSKFNLKITLNKYPPLALDEYHSIPERRGCTFVDPWYVHPGTLAKLPSNVAMQIAIYDIQSTTPCYGGLTFHPSKQTKNAPFIGIVFGDSIKSWGVESGWKTRVATALVHEFYHALDILVKKKGYSLPNPDEANRYGYTTENDPGWIRFDKFLYEQITDKMYNATKNFKI